MKGGKVQKPRENKEGKNEITRKEESLKAIFNNMLHGATLTRIHGCNTLGNMGPNYTKYDI